MGQSYQGSPYDALFAKWSQMSSGHMTELVNGCGVLATALDAGADAIVGMKTAAIAELVALAASFVADQAAAVVTFGLAEAAEAAIIAAARKAVSFLEQELTQYVIGEIIEAGVQPLITVVGKAVDGLVYSAVEGALGTSTGAGDGLRVVVERLGLLAYLVGGDPEPVASTDTRAAFPGNVQFTIDPRPARTSRTCPSSAARAPSPRCCSRRAPGSTWCPAPRTRPAASGTSTSARSDRVPAMEPTGQAATGESVAPRMLGCLLAGAVGDALGAAVEFASIDQIRAEHGPAGITGYAPAFGRRGAITDDTQMTLFTLEGVLRAYERFRERGIANFAGVVHRAYLRWLYTQGYDVGSRTDLNGWLITVSPLHSQRAPGNTCVTALADGPAGTIDQPRNDSKGCGGVMRAAPVAFPPGSVDQVFRNAMDAAALTHGHPSGYLSAGTLAVIVRELLHGADLRTAIATAVEELVKHPGHEETRSAVDAAVNLAGEGRPTPETLATRLGDGWVGEEALAIALCAALCAEDLADGLRLAVNHSGDSDSTGAICGNILGARDGVAAIPEPLLRDLELRDVIIALTRDAIAEFGPNPPTSRVWRLRYPPG